MSNPYDVIIAAMDLEEMEGIVAKLVIGEHLVIRDGRYANAHGWVFEPQICPSDAIKVLEAISSKSVEVTSNSLVAIVDGIGVYIVPYSSYCDIRYIAVDDKRRIIELGAAYCIVKGLV